MKLRVDIKDYSTAFKWIEKAFPGQLLDSDQITLVTRYYALNQFVDEMLQEDRQRLLTYIRVNRKREADRNKLPSDHVIQITRKTHDRLLAYHSSLVASLGDDATLDVVINDMIDLVTY